MEHARAAMVCSLLSGRSLSFENINPKISDSEVAYANLLATLAPGTKVEAQADGRRMTFVPGLLEGGKIELEMPGERTLGYYLEYVLLLLPFAKLNCELTLTGVTNNASDLSADYLVGLVRHIQYFLEEGSFIKIDI